MPLFFDEDHLSLRCRVRGWVDAHLMSTGEQFEIEKAALGLVQQLGAEDFLAFTIPGRYGGKRDKVEARDLCILREELARGSALADAMFALQALGSYPVTLAGSDAQKRRFLSGVATGRAIAALALTEPEAGSDVASLQTKAIRQDRQYSLNGTKCFISNAGIASHYVVFASTAPEKKAKGISAFMVAANTPGLIVKEKTAVLSPHPLGVIAFEDCVVSADSLLGAEGEGLKIAYGSLDVLRCSVGAAAVGLAQRALEEAIRYSKTRRQFGRAIGEFQGIQFKLADMATELEAARLLVYQAAWSHDCAGPDAKLQ
jgi:acyl-CoA dehydrogenase